MANWIEQYYDKWLMSETFVGCRVDLPRLTHKTASDCVHVSYHIVIDKEGKPKPVFDGMSLHFEEAKGDG